MSLRTVAAAAADAHAAQKKAEQSQRLNRHAEAGVAVVRDLIGAEGRSVLANTHTPKSFYGSDPADLWGNGTIVEVPDDGTLRYFKVAVQEQNNGTIKRSLTLVGRDGQPFTHPTIEQRIGQNTATPRWVPFPYTYAREITGLVDLGAALDHADEFLAGTDPTDKTWRSKFTYYANELRVRPDAPQPEPLRVWNVAAAVVTLVEASTEDAAIKKVRHMIEQAGLSVHDGTVDGVDAFESEEGATA